MSKDRLLHVTNKFGELVPLIYVCCECEGSGTVRTIHSFRECPECKGSGYGRC